MEIDFTKAAVIVVDMQKDFYGADGNAEQRGKQLSNMRSVISKINEFVDAVSKRGTKIIYTKFLYDPELSPQNYISVIGSIPKGSFMCLRGTDGAEIDGVHPESSDIIIEKYTYDPFTNPVLGKTLKKFDIKYVIIAGVRTEICVFTTAQRAFTEGFDVIVLSDLVGTYDDRAGSQELVLKILCNSALVTDSTNFF